MAASAPTFRPVVKAAGRERVRPPAGDPGSADARFRVLPQRQIPAAEDETRAGVLQQLMPLLLQLAMLGWIRHEGK